MGKPQAIILKIILDADYLRIERNWAIGIVTPPGEDAVKLNLL